MTMVVAQNPVVQASKTLENLGYLDHTLRIAVPRPRRDFKGSPTAKGGIN